MKVSLYGKIGMKKAYCRDCCSESFVIDGSLQCCGAKSQNTAVDSIVREVEAIGARLPKSKKDIILRSQQFRCYLCGVDLHDSLWYRSSSGFKRIRVEFDHFIPRSYCDNNDFENIYAMCNLCNQHKGSIVFDTRDDAVKYVIEKRRIAGTIELYANQREGASDMIALG